jgi:hypothetical protein
MPDPNPVQPPITAEPTSNAALTAALNNVASRPPSFTPLDRIVNFVTPLMTAVALPLVAYLLPLRAASDQRADARQAKEQEFLQTLKLKEVEVQQSDKSRAWDLRMRILDAALAQLRAPVDPKKADEKARAWASASVTSLMPAGAMAFPVDQQMASPTKLLSESQTNPSRVQTNPAVKQRG